MSCPTSMQRSLPPPRTPPRSGVLGSLFVFLFALACQSTVEGGNPKRPTRPTGTGTGMGVGTPPVATDPATNPTSPTGSPTALPPPPPLDPASITCAPGSVDPPAPRRVMRLQGSELLASFNGVTPIAPGSVPAGFDTTNLGEAPDPTLSVSRTYYDEALKVAMALGQSISANPVGLRCPVAEFGANATCTSAFVGVLANQFFRGAVAAEDGPTLTALAQGMAARTDGKSALEALVGALAMSPKSLYLVEGIDRSVPSTAPAPLSPAEMAAYISFRIAKAPPSAQLIGALTANFPPTAAQVSAAIDQDFTPAMLQRGATDFVSSWLKVGVIPGLTKNLKSHPEAIPAYFASLQLETYDAVTQAVTTGAADFNQLLTGEVRSTLLGDASQPLIATYGRPGVLTLPGVLSVISSSDHTLIPRRGRFLATSLFCELVPPPPPNATSMLPPLAANVSERQKFERIEMETQCGPCHQRVNRLAYAFERYDEVGQLREQDTHNNAIDTAGMHTLSNGDPLVFANAKELTTHAAQHPLAQTCVSLEAFQYVTRRGAGQGRDDCAVASLVANAQKSSFKLTDLFRDALVQTALAPRAD